MIALDTNVLARYLLADDAAQFAAADWLLANGGDCTAPLTVFLELVWVLEGKDLARADIARGLRAVLGLPTFRPHEPQVLARCLAWYEAGVDFADALHLAQCADANRFASFDRRLVKQARRLAVQPPVVAPDTPISRPTT